MDERRARRGRETRHDAKVVMSSLSMFLHLSLSHRSIARATLTASPWRALARRAAT